MSFCVLSCHHVGTISHISPTVARAFPVVSMCSIPSLADLLNLEIYAYRSCFPLLGSSLRYCFIEFHSVSEAQYWMEQNQVGCISWMCSGCAVGPLLHCRCSADGKVSYNIREPLSAVNSPQRGVKHTNHHF